MPYVDGFDDETAPFDDDKPVDELVAEEKGWSQKRYDEMEARFKDLTPEETDEFLDNFVELPKDITEMTEKEMFKIIAEKHSYLEVAERFDEI